MKRGLAILGLLAAVLAPSWSTARAGGEAGTAPSVGPVHSDFNGDGFPDLAVGIPFEEVGHSQEAGGVLSAGAVEVLYGSSSGLVDEQVINQDSPDIEDVAEEDDEFGFAVAAADFNGDGFADLAAGTPFEDTTNTDDGAVQVLYGSASGLQARSPDDQLFTQDSTDVRDSAEVDDWFGWDLATADFNADGFADLAVGVAGEDVGAIADAGAAHVLYGSASGLQATSPNDQFWSQDSSGVEDSAEGFDQFGFALAAADFNADGFADLAAGVNLEDVGAVSNAGAVAVLYGSATGLQATSPNDHFFTQDSPDVRDSAEASDRFGYEVSGGDFNTDGFADLAVGIPDEQVGAIADAGAAHVLYGSASGLQATSPNDQFWSQDSSGVEDSAEGFDQFGFALAAADFNADGFADLAAGVRYEDVGAVGNAGALHVLYGSASGLQATSPDDQFWSQDSPDVEDSAGSDEFGSALAAADFDADGFADVAVGIAKEVPGVFAGALHVLYGSASGLQATSPDDQFLIPNRGTEAADQFGLAQAAGDFDADGFPDLAVGIPFQDVKGLSAAGAVQVLYGSGSGPGHTTPADHLLTQDGLLVDDSAEELDTFGSALASGDFDGDGFADLAVGVPGEDVGTVPSAGAVAVLYGSTSGLQAVSPVDQFWTQDSTDVRDSAEQADAFGAVLTAADFNGDGFADLGIGATGEDVGTINAAGALHVLYGSGSGLQATGPNDDFITQDTSGVDDSAEDSDLFGFSVADGDLNGDGFGDLAVGIPYEDVGALVDAGAVAVLYGSASGLQTTSPADQLWTQDSPDVEDLVESGDGFGYAVAVEDYNADAFADLAAGVWAEDVGAIVSAGAVEVLYGSASGLQATSPADQLWTQDSPDVRNVAEASDGFGAALVGGDFDADGFPDLAVGIPYEDRLALPDTGAVQILHGSGSGIQATSPDDQIWDQDSPDVEDVAENIDDFGSPLLSADLNGDGFADLAVGVPHEDVDTPTETVIDAGAVHVLFGSGSGLQGTDDQFLTEDTDALDFFSLSLAAGS